MKQILKFSLIVFIATFFFACNNTDNSSSNYNDTIPSKISLRFDWIPTMSFSGDIVAKELFAKKNNIDLELEPAYEGIDPIKMVIAGKNQIGIVSAEKFYLANDKGAELVAIGVIDYITPTVFMSKKELNITKPEDFYGKKVGIQSGGATELVYKALKMTNKLDADKITEVQIGFDMKSFINDNFDVRPGFIFDEVVYLDFEGIEYNLVEPKNFGLNFPGRVYFTTKKYYEKNPEIVKNFIYCVAQGWEYALKNPEEAIKLLQKFEPKINYERELAGLKKGVPYLEGYDKKILFVENDFWNNMLTNLSDINILPKMDFKTYNKFDYIKEYHNTKKVD